MVKRRLDHSDDAIISGIVRRGGDESQIKAHTLGFVVNEGMIVE